MSRRYATHILICRACEWETRVRFAVPQGLEHHAGKKIRTMPPEDCFRCRAKEKLRECECEECQEAKDPNYNPYKQLALVE